MEMYKDTPVILFKSPDLWQNWLDKYHTQSQNVWLKLAKKTSGKISVTYEEALDVALCYGWIDGQKSVYDNDYWLQKFSSRSPKSVWSKVNIAKVEVLLNENKMKPAGLESIKNAKQSGAWQTAYDSPRTMLVPKDFQAELDKNPAAKRFFLSLNKTNKYAFCWRVQTAKKVETRKARIEKFVSMLNKGEKLH